jgi:glycosyltransferase involved in cell wall biosynthesis
MRSLLLVTTFNQLKFTKICEESFPSINGLDLLFVDDHSSDQTIPFLKSKGKRFISKHKGRGLTDSWNIGYKIFKDENYDNLFISNNDVIFNKLSIERMISHLPNNLLICPLSTKRGAGHNWKIQDICANYNFKQKEIINDPLKHTDILSKLEDKTKEIKSFNGFFFGLNKNIIEYEYDKEHLFDPKLVNVHQESYICKKIKHKCTLSLGSFIFHYKAQTIQHSVKNGKDARDILELWHKR